MDEQLAAIYGTGQTDTYGEDDLQKTAAAELLMKLAEEQGVDLNQFSDEEIGSMVSELYKSAEEGAAEEKAEGAAHEKAEGAGHEGKEKESEGDGDEKKEEEKVAEADFLGRVMAHAYVQELGNIEKEAGAKTEAIRAGAGKVLDTLRRAAGHAGEWTGVSGAVRGARGMKAHGAAQKKLINYAKTRAKDAPAPLKELTQEAIRGKGAARGASKEELKAGLKRLGLRVGLPGAGAAAIYGMGKASSADESALEALAQERAYELAKEAGWVKEASALDQAVEARALQICEEAGLPVEWNE